MALFETFNMSSGVNMVPDFIKGTLGYVSDGGVNPVGVLIALGLFFTFYMSAKTFSFSMALLVSSFISVVIFGVFAKLGIVPVWLFITAIVAFLLGLLLSTISNSSNPQ